MTHPHEQPGPTKVFALVGNPNSGKTTLFNALTGLRQKVANYPGVTVESKIGQCFSQHGHPITVIDLPGSYSLMARSVDEAIMRDVLLGRRTDSPVPDAVICLLDASNLERNLYLATQVLEIGLPVILVLNKIDEARRRGLRIDHERLEKLLGIRVLPACLDRGEGLTAIRLAMSRDSMPASSWRCPEPRLYQQAVRELVDRLAGADGFEARRARCEANLLLHDPSPLSGAASQPPGPATLREASRHIERLDRETPGWRSELIALRYSTIGDLCREIVRRQDPDGVDWTDRIDRYLLHPVWGFAVLFLVLGILFFSLFSLAAPLMDSIDLAFLALGNRLAAILPPGNLRLMLQDGVVAGVSGVVIFLPQILLLFFFIGLLESTGYMARAAFLLDRLMARVGLHGKSFIPLLSAYACAVPAIMATRTIESPKDRLATILVAPFMTCSARLPVYLLMIAALFPSGSINPWQKSLILLILYSLGTSAALGAAWLIKRFLLRGACPSPVMELPPYRWPRFKEVGREMFERSCIFLRRAGTVILGLSILLWFAMNFPRPAPEAPGSTLAGSFAGQAGQALEPVMRPLGFDWKITVGVLSSFAAREIFVSSMAIVYRVADGDGDNPEVRTERLIETLQAQKNTLGRPVFTPLTCLSLMVFYVFALQCFSTVAVVRRETNSWGWAAGQFAFMLGCAWLASAFVYQGGRWLGY